MTIRYASLGSVSTGTLKSEDLIEAFHSELEYQLSRQDAPEAKAHPDVMAAQKLWDECTDLCWDENGDFRELEDDVLSAYVDELQTALETFAGPYRYFGTLEGDGADFGYWACHDSIDELPKFDEKPDEPQDDDYAVVNGHGNVTVYTGDGTVITEFV